MLHKTRGVVLNITDFSEASVVAHIYTEHFGLQSYLINGVRSKKGKVKQNMLQPLTLLEMVVYHKSAKGLQRASEIRPSPVLQEIPYDIVKTTLAIFLNEVLYKSLKTEEADDRLFEFLFNAVQVLDSSEKAGNFHLLFLTQLTRFLGFFPSTNFDENHTILDLKEGQFIRHNPIHSHIVSPPLSEKIYQLLFTRFENQDEILLSGEDKKLILEKLLEYYKLHLSGFGNIKSLPILQEILH